MWRDGDGVLRRTIPECGEHTPLGCPVLPEVKKTQQVSVSRTGGDAGGTAASGRSTGVQVLSDHPSARSGDVASSGAAASPASSSIRARGHLGSRAA